MAGSSQSYCNESQCGKIHISFATNFPFLSNDIYPNQLFYIILFVYYSEMILQAPMDTLEKLSRLVEALNSKKDADKTAIFKKVSYFRIYSVLCWSPDREPIREYHLVVGCCKRAFDFEQERGHCR